MHVLSAILSSAWAIRPEALQVILAMAERQDIAHETVAAAMHYSVEQQANAIVRFAEFQAVSTRTGTKVDRSNGLLRRGSTAILPIKGPIVRYGNLFTAMSGGGATVETLAKDLALALEDDSFASILLDVDSPGGEASGIGELAQMIFEGRDKKPITAYVSDLGASAGYWLASAADELVVAPAGALGSIGVVMAVRDPKVARTGTIEFVSSMSPHKRPDPHSEGGRAEIQRLVDELGELFVEAVANHRGVSTETVRSDFGAGGLRLGADAVAKGMADRLGTFEGTLAGLAERTRPAPRARPAAAAIATADPTVAAADPERALLVADAAEPSLASDPGEGAAMSSLADVRDRVLALFAELPVDATADQEAAIVSANLNPPQSSPAPAATTAGTEVPAPAVGDTSAERLRRLEADNLRIAEENRQLRLARIRERAQVFCDQQAADLRAMPPELEPLRALYAVLATDDEQYGPLIGVEGARVSRVTLIETLFAARQHRKELTDEMLGGVVTHVLTDRARADRSRDPNAEPDAARLAELMSMTPGGQDLLTQLGAAANGKSAS